MEEMIGVHLRQAGRGPPTLKVCDGRRVGQFGVQNPVGGDTDWRQVNVIADRSPIERIAIANHSHIK